MEQEANYNIFRAGLHPNSTVFWHQTWIVLMRINARVEHSHFSTGHKFAWNTSPTENTDTKTTLCGSDSFFKRNYLTEGFEKTTKEREGGWSITNTIIKPGCCVWNATHNVHFPSERRLISNISKGGRCLRGFEEPWRYWQPIFLNFSNSETKSDWSALEAAPLSAPLRCSNLVIIKHTYTPMTRFFWSRPRD